VSQAPTPAFVEEVARAAGAVLMQHHGRLTTVEKKGARDLVTVADRAAEDLILARLHEGHPDHAILAEESASSQGRAPRLWIVDPLDGTTNFVYRIPHFAVSIAYIEDGVPTLGCVFNPVLDACYIAARGQGATLNGAPIACRQETELSESLLGSGFHYLLEQKADSNLEHWVDFGYRARGLRRLGSAALDLCAVAEGTLDGFWELHLAPWDVAAGALIALESGATVTDLDGGPAWLWDGQIVADNPTLAQEIRSVFLRDPKHQGLNGWAARPVPGRGVD
jgi:myo-inositol-1(or 4)-monophosphatase